MTRKPRELAILSNARRALAEARTADDLKHIGQKPPTFFTKTWALYVCERETASGLQECRGGLSGSGRSGVKRLRMR